jgi:membrane-associated phospholipid phosphatase
MAVSSHSPTDRALNSPADAASDRGLRLVAIVLVASIAIVTAITLVGPNIDLALTRLFAAAEAPRFPAGRNALAAALRDRGMVAGIVCAGCVVLALTKYLPWRLPSLSHRAAGYLITAYLLGPGLLVNGILKAYWGRPRPGEVLEFGGSMPFVNWWNPGGACPSNCSFISGEAAAAAWLFGPAMLAPARWRPLAMWLAAAFFVLTAGLRVAAGGHFLTDVLIGGLSSVLVLLALHPVFWPRAGQTNAPA